LLGRTRGENHVELGAVASAFETGASETWGVRLQREPAPPARSTRARKDGEEVIVVEHCDRVAEDVAPDWPKSRKGGWQGTFRVRIDGEPSFDGGFEVGHRPADDANDHGLLATAMRAVNAIPWVCEAPPGIVGALHLPLTPPLGALHPKRDGVLAFD
jgi:hypothetical protein